MKNLLLLITFSLSLATVYGQGWTTCSTTSGTLSGNTTDVADNQAIAAAVYTTAPSPMVSIPNNGFFIVLHDSLAYDGLGNAIVGSSIDGGFTPSTFNLVLDDTLSVVSFSYDIQQFKILTQGILTNTVPFIGTCCDVMNSQSPVTGFCDSLNLVGIADSSDINTLEDVINIVSIYKYGTVKPLSLKGVNDGLVSINTQLSPLSAIGCSNGITQLCYAFDTLAINHDRYVIKTVSGIIENDFGNNLMVYPNPTHGSFSVDMGKKFTSLSVKITDLTGKIVQSQSFNYVQILNLDIEEPAGVYLLTIQSAESTAVIRLIKK